MVQVVVTEELNELLDSAASFSVQRGKYYVGVEHLFEAIVAQLHSLPVEFLSAHEGALERALALQTKYFWSGVPPAVGGDVFYTPRCADVIKRANRLADRMKSDGTTAGHVLLALLTDAHASPCRAMDAHDLGRRQMIDDLKDALIHLPRRTTPTPFIATPEISDAPGGELTPQPRAAAQADPIAAFTRDLTELAREGSLRGAIGREQETMQVLEVMARQGKNNVILVGEAGTGKTCIVEGLAIELVKGTYAGAVSFDRIIELNIGGLMAGTQYRGVLEEKVQALIAQLESRTDTVLFIDEIHLIMGTGAAEGDSVDIANLIKPALGRGRLRTIGATTSQEYRRFIEKDPAIERRFQMVRVEPLSSDATLQVLSAIKPELEKHHRVRIQPDAMDTAVTLTDRYMPNRNQPDKAIDVLDQACARARIKRAMLKHASQSDAKPANGSIPITSQDIRKIVSQAVSVPLEQITAEERIRLTDMERRLSETIIGQEHAVKKVVAAVKKARAGLADPNRPETSMLFLGPTGVGKTQLAKELARLIFGSRDYLITFDMSEYVEAHSVSKLLGAPPGYQGSDREGLLADAIRRQPYSILLFDEIEKAHPQIFDVFLPILDEGRLKDAQGRIISFRNCILIFTSNVGADRLQSPAAIHEASGVMDELRKHFRPEFINRIDEIVPFHPLLFEDVRVILKKQVDEVRRRLRDRSIGIRMYQRAYEYLAEIGYNPAFGARELKRAVERHVAQPIAEGLLDGRFADGDMVDVLMVDGALAYQKGAPHEAQRNRSA